MVFTVEYGDGTEPQELTVTETEADEEEFEAEAEGVHRYEAEGTYDVTVTATPDVGEPASVVLTVRVTSDPVAYARDTDLACPDGQVPHSGFADVATTSVHEGAIDCLVWRGVVAGTGASTYAPDVRLTRAQMATFLARLLEAVGVDLPDDPEDLFGDDEDSIHETAINQLADLGLVSGSTEGDYRPEAPLSRSQMAALLVRLVEFRTGAGLSSELDYFLDDDTSTHETAINLAAASGLGAGRALGVFDPDAPLTRAELATFLARALDLLDASASG